MKSDCISEKLKYVFKQINEVAKEQYECYHLDFAWLLHNKDKMAVLFVFELDEKNCVCLLSNLDGIVVYQHTYHDYNCDCSCYYEVFDYFGKSNEVQIPVINIEQSAKEKYEELIEDTSNYNNKFFFKYCKHYDGIAELEEQHSIQQVAYICSIFQLDQSCNIGDALNSEFWLRYGITNEKDQFIAYYDVAFYLEDNNEYSCVDDYVIDIILDR